MPPRVKFQKEDIVNAAYKITREKGIEAVTAREIAKVLNVSVGPIFTWFSSMDELKKEVYSIALSYYRDYINKGLEEKIPFLGVWHQYIAFARKEPDLYSLIFLSGVNGVTGSTAEALKYSQDLARESLMKIYKMNAFQADCYFRDLWLVGYSFATMIVTGNCSFTDEQFFEIGAEISLSVCKAYKEIPGLPEGKYDKDAIFRELVK